MRHIFGKGMQVSFNPLFPYEAMLPIPKEEELSFTYSYAFLEVHNFELEDVR